MVIYLLILIIVIALVVILTRYMAKSYKAKQIENEKERIAKEEQIQVVVQQINIDHNNVLPYLDEALLHKDHYFTFSEKEKFLETTKDLYRKIKSIEDDISYVGVPSLVNFTPDTVFDDLVVGLNKIDYNIVKMINEIEYTPYKSEEGTTIDNNLFTLTMNDGNIVKIAPHMSEIDKDLKRGHNIRKLFLAGVFDDLVKYER